MHSGLLCEGLGGVLYSLSRLHKVGFSIDACSLGYSESWNYIEENCLSHLQDFAAGLYSGAAGLALTLANGIQSGLLASNELNKSKIRECLEFPNNGLDLANGITGNGIAILQCKKYLSSEVQYNLLSKIISSLLDAQQKDGLWTLSHNSNKTDNGSRLSFSYGIPGVLWFILEYISFYKNGEVQVAIEKALKWLLKGASLLNNKNLNKCRHIIKKAWSLLLS